MTDHEIKSGTKDTVKFWDLPELEKYKQLEGETNSEFLARINDSSKWLYGSEARDEMLLRDNSTLPFYAHLSRKAFIHYAGSRYNPHTVDFIAEHFIRSTIKMIIEYKVKGKAKGYDKEAINWLLFKSVHDALELPLPDDCKPIDREVLPEFRSIYHGLDFETQQ